MNRRIKILFLLFIFLFLLKHVPLNYEYSKVPTSYSADTEYSLQHLLQNGHTLSQNSMQDYIFTSYTAGIFISDVYLVNHILLAIILLLSLSDPTIHYYNFDSWLGDIIQFIFLVCNLAIVNKITKFDTNNTNILNNKYLIYYIGFVLLGSFTTFSYSKGTSNAYICYILLITTFICIFEKKSSFIFLSILLAFMIPVYYQTPGLVFLMIAFTMTIYSIFPFWSNHSINRGHLLGYSFFLLYLIFWLGYNIYITKDYFYTIVDGFMSFFLVKEPLGVNSISNYIIKSSKLSVMLNFFNGLFVSFPVIYYLIASKRLNTYSKSFCIALILSLPLLTVFFYSFGGFWILFQRMAEWGSIISILIIGVIFFTPQIKSKKIIVIISILAIISTLSLSVINSDTLLSYSSMTVQEEIAGEYLANHMQTNDRVFTDNRLIGSFVKNNRFNIIGINDVGDNESEIIDELTDVYYSTDESKNSDNVLNKYNPNYLFFSKTMSNTPPGIKGYNYFFKAADDNYLQKFCNASNMNLVYSNDQVLVFLVQK